MTGTKTRKKAPRQPQDAPPVLAGRMRAPRDAGDKKTTLSGRCGRCGYLIGSPGHQNSCG